MYQGWRGDWQFTLPFTPAPGQGSYLFLFYLSLGHLARLIHLPLVTVFHLARLAAIVALLFALYTFLEKSLSDPKWQTSAFILALFASGMGWLAVPFGGFTSDFWVSEMYPFLSAYASPHFALGLALLLFIITPAKNSLSNSGHFPWLYALAALVLALVSPFGIVVALVVLGSRLAWDLRPFSLQKIRLTLNSRMLWVLLAGSPIMFYDLWIVRVNPVLAGWNAQNITPSPAPWDLILSLSPFLWLAIPGAVLVVKRKDANGLTLLFWAVLGLVLIYLPFSLQRRFLMGIFIPFVALAIIGLDWLARGNPKRSNLYTFFVLGLAIPTNLVILMAGFQGIQTHDSRLFTTTEEVQAIQWLRSNTADDALILAAPQTGLLIPAQTGRRVIYGHPFESMNADATESEVVHFYETGDPAILEKYPVQYIFYGPSETLLNPAFPLQGLKSVYSAGGVTIYATPP